MNDLEKQIRSFFGVSPDEQAQLLRHFKPETLKKGDFYARIGRPCIKLSYVHSGLLRVYAPHEDRDVTQWISTPGYFIADIASLSFKVPARRHIQALTDVEMYTLHEEDYQRIGREIPRWHELEKLFVSKCFAIMEDRIFSHLSLSAEERYQLFFEHNRELLNTVPLQYIASMLGMTPETFSRIRRKSIS